jgi:hypothetical protein
MWNLKAILTVRGRMTLIEAPQELTARWYCVSPPLLDSKSVPRPESWFLLGKKGRGAVSIPYVRILRAQQSRLVLARGKSETARVGVSISPAQDDAKCVLFTVAVQRVAPGSRGSGCLSRVQGLCLVAGSGCWREPLSCQGAAAFCEREKSVPVGELHSRRGRLYVGRRVHACCSDREK